ncbi:hypothetical protein GE253_13965 [Niveispirillum sp. SYP-B3756]|uniref:hypothetical protein n=1 Tax=Niveispirillum sp. SYP-B3756 TaxID=2662178 RepID=UPI00129116CB|nr:hypothetical protein [Niveispirillum sp. SYP-B3756]MQP66440.1 hypothetical protein [Niveispirillum sp. SYP-B3756]
MEDNPAYYTSSTYYGAADVLTLAIAGAYQPDGVGTARKPGDYSTVSIDVLFEKKLGSAGAVTLEGAWYSYDTDNVGGIVAGDAWMVAAAYLLPGKVGIGQFQPFARYQTFNPDALSRDIKQYDLGVHYVIKGHSARVSAEYSNIDSGTGGKQDRFTLGLQLQF